MKEHFVNLVLYGVCVVMVLFVFYQSQTVRKRMDEEETGAYLDNTILLNNAIPGYLHRLPANVERSLLSALKHSLSNHVKNQRDKGEALEDVLNSTSDNPQPWQQFINQIHRHVFYSEGDPLVEALTRRMRTLKIVEITENPNRGSEFKLFIKLEDGTPVIAKPRRLMVNHEAPPYMKTKHCYELFQAEVAAYHLSRILNFNLVPPVVSRYINLTSEIYPLAPESLKKTFFKNANGETCLTGHCRNKCNKENAICGQPDVVPASFAFLIPELIFSGNIPNSGLSDTINDNINFCNKLKKNIDRVSKNERTHLDIVDIRVFDFIQGNLDRHHYGQIKAFGGDSQPVLYDNGRGFVRSYQDELYILSPIYMCCQMRLSTFEKLINVYQREGRLSAAMRNSLKTELVQPLLTEQQLLALDRRIVKVLEVIYICISRYGERILIDDGY